VVSRICVLRRVDERLGIGVRMNGVHCQETWGIRKRVWKGGGDIREKPLAGLLRGERRAAPKREWRQGTHTVRLTEIEC